MSDSAGPAPREGDQRRHPRLRIEAFVKVLGEEREYVFRTRDLSRGGLFLYTRVGHIYPFRVGDALAIELYDFDQCVTCHAVVRRVVEEGTPESSQYPLGFGLEFVGLDGDNAARLEAMLERCAQGEDPY